MTDHPVHDHDCDDGCIFVGANGPVAGEPRVNQVDLYVHLRPHGDHELIRRYGSAGADYSCFGTKTIALMRIPHFLTIVEKAKASGVLTED